MKIIDLSHRLAPDMPVFPGTGQPQFRTTATVADNGFAEKLLMLHSHMGTHVDAPAHLFNHGATIDEIAPENFFGKALRFDIQAPFIKPADLSPLTEMLTGKTVEFILFATGWSRLWGKEDYFSGYPVLTAEGADLLCRLPLKGIGFDTLSVDRTDAADLPIHRILLRKMILIENLTNLAELPRHAFHFSCLPLKIAGGDGSPVRAIALCEEDEQST